MRILTAAEMAAVDRRAIEEIGIPGAVLMENAALGVVDALGDAYPEAAAVAVFCGPGNNGGDGLAIARQLDTRGYRCRVFLAPGRSLPQGDAGLQLKVLRALGVEVEELPAAADLDAARQACLASDVVVDALFGTGLTRPLAGHFAALVELLNAAPGPLLAVDLPSGLFGGERHLPGPHVEAALTVTFGAPKVAHVFPPAAGAVGRLVVADLGIPPWLLDEAPGDLHLSVAEELAELLTEPAAAAHKGDFGHLLLVGGSPGKAGAVVLGARAAVRGGAGLVTAAVPAPLLPTVAGGSWESMTLALPAAAGGLLGEEAVEPLLAAAAERDAVALGPGLGTAPPTVAAVRRLVAALERPLVLDADGLNAFAGRLGELAARRAPTLLTPHPGEMGRLLGISTAAVQEDRLAAVRRAAAESGAAVVLKGFQSLVAATGAGVHVNPTGNPGMATGGSGDVLTGLLGALVGRGLGVVEAARLGVFVHGLAGDLAAAEHGGGPLRAGDLVEALPRAFARLRGE